MSFGRVVGVVGAILLVLATSVRAEPAPLFEGTEVLELLRPTDVIGDGATAVELVLLALAPDGRPLQGMKARFSTMDGTATELVDRGGGLHTFSLVPGKVDRPASVALDLKVKLPGRTAFTRTWAVPSAPARTRTLQVTASPPTLMLGVDKTANLDFRILGGDPRATVALGHAVSTGTVTNVTDLGGGQVNALFTVPTTKSPLVALLTAVDRADPTRSYGAVAIPLAASVAQVAAVAPRAKVMIKVGGRDFGPVPADARGRATVPIVVPPGASDAVRVEIREDGTVINEPLDLKIPEARRIALFPTAEMIPADGRLRIPIRALVVTPTGAPDGNASVAFSASVGTFDRARHEGGGIHVAEWVPPFGNVPTVVTFGVKLADGSAVQADTRKAALVPVRATRIDLAAEPMGKDATAMTVDAKVIGPDGTGLAGRELAFTADGARLLTVEDRKNGDYRATFTPTGKGPVDVTAVVPTPATGGPLARVLLVPSRKRVTPDGLSSVMISVFTLDDSGYPAPDVAVELRLVTGDGALPPSITTDAHGMARVYYTAGRKHTLVAIDAIAWDRTAGLDFLQVPDEASLPDLPITGSEPARTMIGELAVSMPALRVERAP